MPLQCLPYLNHWLLLPIPSLSVFLQQSHEEAVCAGLGGAGTQTLTERLQASLRPLSQQRNQPGGKTKTHSGKSSYGNCITCTFRDRWLIPYI